MSTRPGSSPARPAASAASGRSPPWSAATASPPPPATPRAWTTSSSASATCSCRCSSTSPTAPRSSRPSQRRTSASGGSTSWSTTPATASSGWSRSCPRPRRATRSRPTCSARCGSPRPRCRILRAQGSGHILQVSSIGGISAFPNIGDLPRVEVGAGGLQPVAGPGGRRLRHQGHADRARRLLHRLGRRVGAARRPRCRPTTTLREQAAEARKARLGTPGDPAATRAAVLEVVDAERPAAADLLRRRPAGDRDARLRVAAGDLAGVGAGVDRSAREEGLTLGREPARVPERARGRGCGMRSIRARS